MLAFFGVVAVALSVIQYSLYLWSIYRGETKPHAFSWFVWSLPTIVVFYAQYGAGAGSGSWATASTALLCTIIFFASLVHGEQKITVLDTVSLTAACIGMGLWYYTQNPLGAVVLISIIDVLGFVPTVRKSYDKPGEEHLTTYTIGGVKWVFALAALGHFSVVTVLYPLSMVIANLGFVVFVLFRVRYGRLSA
jgi:hypothetical protein